MNSQRILLTWGMVWLLVAMFGGIYLGPQVHSTREAKEAHFENALEHLSARQSESAMEELQSGLKLAGDSGDRSTMHSHVACMSFVALLIGLLQPFMGLSRKWKLAIAWVIVAGSVLHGAGVYGEKFHLIAGSAMAGIGASALIFGAVTSFIGILKFVRLDK